MRLAYPLLGLAVLPLLGCGQGAPEGSSTVADTVRQCVAVWERGAEAIPVDPTPPADPEAAEESEGPLHDFDARVRWFLSRPYVTDAVQFSCAIQGYPVESWVTGGLDDPDAEVRLRALVALVRVRAPRTVLRQWAVLQELCRGPLAAEIAPVTTRLRAAFSPEALDRTLGEPPPGEEYSTPAAYQWALRAAGVTRHRGALARLVELSRSDLLDVSLSAERSLEDFEGPESSVALARCVDGWRYDAAMRAASALLRRDPERLRATLLASEPPPGDVFWKGIYLARLGDRRGVPILCATVPDLDWRLDGEMFDAIERLAGAEDLPDVEALPARVQDRQRERATAVVAAVRRRLDAGR